MKGKTKKSGFWRTTELVIMVQLKWLKCTYMLHYKKMFVALADLQILLVEFTLLVIFLHLTNILNNNNTNIFVRLQKNLPIR